MKRHLAFLTPILFLGGTSFAAECPHFSGTYYCTFEATGPQSLEISQRETNGITTFTFNGNEAIADGLIHKMPDDEELKEGLYKAICSSTELLIWQKANLVFANGYLEAMLRLSFDQSGNLINENQGKMIVDGNEKALDNRGVCVRK